MPESLFRQTAAAGNQDVPELDRLRAEIIGTVSRYSRHGPVHASTCYVWPSSECPVGCGHCNYASPMSLDRLTRYSVARDPGPVINLMNGMGLWKAVLSGGGEPMVEPEFCERFVHEIDSPDLEEIELITSAHFAATQRETRSRLTGLVDAWRSRPENLRRARSAATASPAASTRSGHW